MDTTWLIAVVVMIVVPGILGFQIGSAKDRDSGLALGVFLSWFGILILLLMPSGGRPCPDCAERVKRGARVCKHCGARIA